MSRKIGSMVVLMTALMVIGCATTAPYVPFKVSQEEFYGKTKTIALTPVGIPADVENRDMVKEKFESRIEAKLREGGFSVIPAKEYSAIWKKMTEQMGGYFDTVTGKRDEEKFKAVREHTFRELKEVHKADALLFAGTQTVSASWSSGTARWHGTTDSMKSTGQQVLEVFAGVSSHGHVPALSLGVAIRDMEGANQYVNWGGIQVLSKISGIGMKFVSVPLHEILANDDRNAAAVNIALDPLVRKTEAESGSKEEKEKKEK